MRSFITATLGLAAIAEVTSAMQAYLDYIPNGSLFSQELGHPDNDSSQYTDFATAFEAVGLSWTADFCADTFPNSDMTNGAAFGDPCCTWSQGGTPDFTVSPFTTDPTTATVCATASSTTSSATTSTAASTTASTAASSTTDTSTTSTVASTTSSATTDTSTTSTTSSATTDTSTTSTTSSAATSTAASSTTDTTTISTASSSTTETETTAPSTDSNTNGGGCRAKSHTGKKNGLRA